MDQAVVLGTKLFVQLEGKTNGAHQSFVTKLKDIGHIEVDSLDKSDFLLVFCPIVSRVGTAISDALENIPDDKPTILVVMHHTFDPDHVVAESRRLVEKPNVQLTVDCLFYEGKLLNCDCNKTALFEVQKNLELPAPEVLPLQPGGNDNSDFLVSRKASVVENTARQYLKAEFKAGEQNKKPGKGLALQDSTLQPGENDKSESSVTKIFIQFEGKTNGAHHSFVTKLKDIGHIVVDSIDESDFLLVFCPIVSRVGTDISDALENIPDGKATILVVMHHTFDPDHVVAESRRLVKKPNVQLTVDCLFYEGKLLKCDRNKSALFEIQELVGVPSSQEFQTIASQVFSWVFPCVAKPN